MTTEQLIEELAGAEGRYTHSRMTGVAFYIQGGCEAEHTEECEQEWAGDCDCPPEHEGCVIGVMVGDDYRHHIDPDDLTLISEDDYCGGCGQIGCGW